MEKEINSEIIIGSKLSISRNLNGFNFTSNLIDSSRLSIQKKIENEIQRIFKDKLKCIKLSEIESPEIYFEDGLITSDLLSNRNFSSFYINDNRSLIISILGSEHFKLDICSNDMGLEKLFSSSKSLINELDPSLKFSYDNYFGALTSDVSITGNAMRADLYLHLPVSKRSGILTEILKGIQIDGVKIEYINGSKSLSDSAIFSIYNSKNIGISEVDTIDNIKKVADKLIKTESSFRETFYEKYKLFFEDKIHRGLGTLKYARSIGLDEALLEISNIRLGISLGVLNSYDYKMLFDLSKNIQKNHILAYKKEFCPDLSENEARAKYIRDHL